MAIESIISQLVSYAMNCAEFNIRLPEDQVERFEVMTKKDRCPHGGFLKILMNHDEG